MSNAVKNLISGIIVILMIILFTTLSRCSSISIGDTKISIIKDAAYSSSIFDGKNRTLTDSKRSERAERYENWEGKTRHTVSLDTPSGNIVIPRNSRVAKRTTGYETVTFTSASSFYDKLTILGNEITQGISSISMNGDGEIMEFSVHNEPTPMTLNKITMKVLNMRRGFSVNYQPKRTVTQYVYFRCNDISPIELDKDSTIIFNDNENKTFSVNIEENNYGFYVYKLTSSSRKKSFTLKHPSLEKETQIYQIRFDVFYNEVIGYKINSDDEEIIISYKERNIDVNGESGEDFVEKILREALRRNQ
ncbi:hypothetical protein FACS189461_0510 [Spirochaetia bacterium]|nr:hypothetical protein FACS189461_0510 [Spirochaetia bacterium]